MGNRFIFVSGQLSTLFWLQ